MNRFWRRLAELCNTSLRRLGSVRSLAEKSIEMFEALGYDCSEVRNKGRRLVLPIKNANIEVILAKAADVITYVENGVCDLGVVGKDTIMEAGGTFMK